MVTAALVLLIMRYRSLGFATLFQTHESAQVGGAVQFRRDPLLGGFLFAGGP